MAFLKQKLKLFEKGFDYFTTSNAIDIDIAEELLGNGNENNKLFFLDKSVFDFAGNPEAYNDYIKLLKKLINQ